MTQAAIAARLGVSGPTARDYLYAGSLPRMKKLREIAATLRVDSSWLFDGTGLKRPQLTTRIAVIASVAEDWMDRMDWKLTVQQRRDLYDYLLADLDGMEVTPQTVTRRLENMTRFGFSGKDPDKPGRKGG